MPPAPPAAPAAPAADSVPIGAVAARKKSPPRLAGLVTFRAVAALFLMFLFVVSDVFTAHVVANVRGSVAGRTPTTTGVLVQGVCLVLFYVLALYLIDAEII